MPIIKAKRLRVRKNANSPWTDIPAVAKKGEDGPPGERGEKGDPFVFEDFTPDQLALLKGERGDPGKKGDKGDDYILTDSDKAEISKMALESIDVPQVFNWANADRFDKANFSGGWFAEYDGEEYFVYNDNATNFTYTMPNPQRGSVMITFSAVRRIGDLTKTTSFRFIYSDGTIDLLKRASLGEVHTFVTRADKTLVEWRGDWAQEYNVYMKLSDISIIADYPAPARDNEVEHIENKVAALTDESTDEQYPSAKAVQDRFTAMETALGTYIDDVDALIGGGVSL